LKFNGLDIDQNWTKVKLNPKIYDSVVASQVHNNTATTNVRYLSKQGGAPSAETSDNLNGILEFSDLTGEELDHCNSNGSILLITLLNDKDRQDKGVNKYAMNHAPGHIRQLNSSSCNPFTYKRVANSLLRD
jgi:hypothetical protein